MENSYWAKAPERFLLGKAYHDIASVVGWDRAVEIGSRVWELRTPPSRRQDRGRGLRGGAGRIYIPKNFDPLRDLAIVRIAGIEDAKRLIERFAGDAFEFPCIAVATTARRNRAIVEAVAEGTRKKVVACSFGMTERQVRRICRTERVALLLAA